MNRDIDKVIVLGSGKSINNLSKEEIAHINRCKMVIAFNKYMAFHDLVGIIPTHVYFLDVHDNSLKILSYILKKCRKDNLKNLIFIVNSELKKLNCSNQLVWLIKKIKIKLSILPKIFSGNEKRRHLKMLFGDDFLLESFNTYRFFFTNHIDYMKHGHGGEWSKSISPLIYHYRGSLTSILNICSILSPNTPIYLIGNDFNSSEYFFEQHLENFEFSMNDFTTPIIKEKDLHFSVIDYKGTTIFDVLPFIINKLKETGNDLFCINPDSLLVTKGGVEYLKLID